jgi:hypothetical protein
LSASSFVGRKEVKQTHLLDLGGFDLEALADLGDNFHDAVGEEQKREVSAKKR